MKTNLKPVLNGLAVAFAAASLIGCATADTGSASNSSYDDGIVKCQGVNSCKGHNDCATADNACAGQSACKGQGFVNMATKTCEQIGGILLVDSNR